MGAFQPRPAFLEVMLQFVGAAVKRAQRAPAAALAVHDQHDRAQAHDHAQRRDGGQPGGNGNGRDGNHEETIFGGACRTVCTIRAIREGLADRLTYAPGDIVMPPDGNEFDLVD